MADEVDKANKMLAMERRKEILSLVKDILSGKVNSEEMPLSDLFELWTSVRDQYQLFGPRRTYISPDDRSSYDYGYMHIHDMNAGTPNNWDE